MKKNLNIIFITGIFGILCLIGVLNYTVDPYHIKINLKQKNFIMKQYPRFITSTVLKLTKNERYEIVIIGTSLSASLFDNIDIPDKRFANLSNNIYSLKRMKNYLECFLELHPEVKTVILPIEYHSFFDLTKDMIPEIKTKSLTLKELHTLLFSVDTTKLSIAELKNKNIPIPRKRKTDNKYSKIYTRRLYATSVFGSNIESDLTDIFNLLKSKNIDTIFIFPPYHALYNAKLYTCKKWEKIENIKRLTVRQNARVLDYSMINKYTSKPLEETNLYSDMVHSNNIYGHAMINAIYKITPKSLDKKLYTELTQNNIEEVLKKENNSLKIYVQKNERYIKEHLNPDIEDWSYFVKYKPKPEITFSNYDRFFE